MVKYEVGEHVIVARRSPKDRSWAPLMNNYINKELIVKGLTYSGHDIYYFLSDTWGGGSWWYHEDDLEPAYVFESLNSNEYDFSDLI